VSLPAYNFEVRPDIIITADYGTLKLRGSGGLRWHKVRTKFP